MIAARIAAHAADLAKGNKDAWDRDLQMARARVVHDIESQIKLSIDPDKTKTSMVSRVDHHYCDFCGPDCAAQITARYFGIPAV